MRLSRSDGDIMASEAVAVLIIHLRKSGIQAQIFRKD